MAVPVKLESGVNVTDPFEFTEYVPWFAMTTLVAVQFGEVCGGLLAGSQSLTLLGTSEPPEAAESLPRMEITWATPW